jgi:acyl-CoA thioesterase FadM
VTPFNIEFSSRGYELDAEGFIPVYVMLRYMEHLRWGYSIRHLPEVVALFEEGHTFVVVSQTLRVEGDIGMAVPIRGQIWIAHTGRTSLAFHQTFHAAEGGELLAAARTTAVYLGQHGAPAPLPEYIREDPEPLDIPDLNQPELPEMPAATFAYSCRVRTSDLDFLGHMNQANYAAFYDDARRAATGSNAYGSAGLGCGRIRLLHIDYGQPAMPDQRLAIATWKIESNPLRLGFAMLRNDTVISRALMEL